MPPPPLISHVYYFATTRREICLVLAILCVVFGHGVPVPAAGLVENYCPAAVFIDMLAGCSAFPIGSYKYIIIYGPGTLFCPVSRCQLTTDCYKIWVIGSLPECLGARSTVRYCSLHTYLRYDGNHENSIKIINTFGKFLKI